MIQERVRAAEIEPSLYAADFARLGDQVDELMDAGARVFHYDVGDGQFIEPITIGPIVLESIAPLIQARGGMLDCHLMVIEPERQFAQIARAGGHSVTFHVEATDDPSGAIRLAHELGLGAGVAFNPETPVEDAVAAAEGADLALCMCIHPGYSGQEFMPESLERIAALRAALPDRIPVQVDGGITAENIGELHVAGSSIFAGRDAAGAYTALGAKLA